VSAGSQVQNIDGVSFTQIQPTNQEAATAKGLELALQHTFNSGWGLQTNYTYTASSAQFLIDTTQEGTQTFAIEGLSPASYNIIGFYENTHFSARASYNWRQEYLRAVVGAQSQPESVESYGQLDVNFSVNITPKISIFAQGINVLKEETRLFSIYKNRVIKNEYTGARYILGISANF
jgi:TonB-dependent receptor